MGPFDPDARRVARLLGMPDPRAVHALEAALAEMDHDPMRCSALWEAIIHVPSPAVTAAELAAAEDGTHEYLRRLADREGGLDHRTLFTAVASLVTLGDAWIERQEDGPDPEEDEIEDHERIDPEVLRRLFQDKG